MVIPTGYPTSPKLVWDYFHQITTLPRPSKHEDRFREFILQEAKKLNLKTHVDQVGNVIVYVPASPGDETKETVIIQNHMDMVTDALPEKKINFLTDAIETYVEGDWLKAKGTTLGADNGIGCAAALALMSDRTLKHPALELLFTIDEETGLKGAWGVEASALKGRRMLNLDTEEWGSLYIGCAGGIDYDFQKDFTLTKSKFNSTYKLTVSGFLGGHSGVDIHEQRGNAIKFLHEWLSELGDGIEICELRGGKAHNIIPRDAFAIINAKNSEGFEKKGQELIKKWKAYLPQNDQKLEIKVDAEDTREEVVGSQDRKLVLNFLSLFPHGAHSFDLASGGELVSLSNNLAICLLVNGKFYLQTSLRFFDRQECESLERKIRSLADVFQMELKKNGEYPSWKPVRENKLLDFVIKRHETLFGRTPKVTAIHAGLECGILRDKIGPIDVVSFGPTIMGAHSPQERVEISTVEKFWFLLKDTLENLQ